MHDYIHTASGKLFFNRQMFGHIAPRYDFITRALSFGLDTSWKNQLIKELPDSEKLDCLDIACGTGDLTFRLAAQYPAGRIVALDLTEEMVNYARINNRFSNITFTIANMCRMDFPDNSFDIITGGYALRNAPNLEEALKEIHRVMKPGATAAILDFSKPASHFLQKIELLLLKFWGGFWGILLHRNPQLYTYIAESLQQFPDRTALKQMIKGLGFINLRSRKHFLGFTETISFQKP
jgi:ubiquinone/menaquinone biosynthesis methyltransferase